jgi:hypothetical protein
LAFPTIILSTAKAEKYYSIPIWFQYFKSILKHFSYQPDLDDIGYFLKLSYQPGLDEIGYIFKFSYQPDPGIGYLLFIEKIIIHTRLVVLVLNPHDHSVFSPNFDLKNVISTYNKGVFMEEITQSFQI